MLNKNVFYSFYCQTVNPTAAKDQALADAGQCPACMESSGRLFSDLECHYWAGTGLTSGSDALLALALAFWVQPHFWVILPVKTTPSYRGVTLLSCPHSAFMVTVLRCPVTNWGLHRIELVASLACSYPSPPLHLSSRPLSVFTHIAHRFSLEGL